MSELPSSLRKLPPETPNDSPGRNTLAAPSLVQQRAAGAIPIYPAVPSYMFKKDKQTHFDELKKNQISSTSTESPTKFPGFRGDPSNGWFAHALHGNTQSSGSNWS
jgi:hypothetical protein